MKKMFKILFVSLLLFITNESAAQDIPKWKIEDLQQIIDSSSGPTVLNFWATFCAPCLKEMPSFDKASQQYKNDRLNLYFISLDAEEAYPKKINALTKRLKISAPVIFLDESNADIFCPVVDKNWSGAIPGTLFINNKTGYRKFVEDELAPEALEKELQKMLQYK
jgi:thiol-disulfide isomerase/thioredoxin